ncbi:MAG: hypothetical protein FWG50_00465 [Kiritimatiellaeota bacterium]|nr:hypothetical protein [Kiritimatiellota bacterium]
MSKRWMIMLAALPLCVLAGELPFTAVLRPYMGPQHSSYVNQNMVNFKIINDSPETITGIIVTRNNGAPDNTRFNYVIPGSAGVGGMILTPNVVASSADASGIGYIREYWQYPAGFVLPSMYPVIEASYVSSDSVTGRSIQRTGNFGDFLNVGDYFMARMHGYLTVPQAGKYHFQMRVDDCGYVLYRRSDGSAGFLFNERWNDNQGKWHTSDTTLTFAAGEVIYLDAFHLEAAGNDYLNLEWAREEVLVPELETESERHIALLSADWLYHFSSFLLLPLPPDYQNKSYGPDLSFGINTITWKGKTMTASNFYWEDYFDVCDYINHAVTWTFQPIPSMAFSTKRPVAGSPWFWDSFPTLNDTTITDNGGANKSIRIAGLALTSGNEMQFAASLEDWILVNAIHPEGYNYAPEVLWNLPASQPKATITVFGSFGNSSTITLGATPDIAPDRDYTFKSDARPLKLKVRSIGEDGNPNKRAARFRVTITDPTSDEAPLVRDNIDLANEEDLVASFEFNELRAGMQVLFEAVEESYFDKSMGFLFHTFNQVTEASKIAEAVERYVASGLSVNDTAQTGDPTQYSFEIRGDTRIDFRTRHEYALDVSSDFTKTEGKLLNVAGKPWTGPLTSAASGAPDPAAGVGNERVRHWIEEGTQVTAQIDAEVQDIALSAQLLNVRYVPYEYHAKGAARGDVPFVLDEVSVNALPPPDLLGLRHQINFKMTSPGSIDYLWKIQFGAYAQSPEGNLRKVQRYNSDGAVWEEVPPLGAVYWFDQGDGVRVLTAANKDSVDSKALTGWVLGDGYYFASECNINTDTGEPVGMAITLDVNNNPVAQWVTETIGGKAYRGLEIANLLRPAAVTWSYGRQVFYDPMLTLGEYMLQGRSDPIEKKYPAVAARLFDPPTSVDPPDAAIWDPNAKVLFPIKPGLMKAIYTGDTPDSGFEVHVTAKWPAKPHYAHVADTPPVQLSPDPNGSFLFVEKSYEEDGVQVVIQNNSEFTAAGTGWSLLRFKEIKRVGRSDPKEYITLRTVRTQPLQSVLSAEGEAVIGRAVRDPLDLAGFGTGYLFYQEGVRYNASIYDSEKLAALRSTDVYDMAKLKALYPERVILDRSRLPGPIIPVNEYPAAVDDILRIAVVWYDDPVRTDGLLWPYAARRYRLRWPVSPAEGLGRIVIASEWGSESLGADAFDQVIAFADGAIPEERTFNPTRFAELKVYSQGNPALAGYNPNEEHALIAPSLRYAAVSPRPNAVYALRAGDLNNYGGVATSKPFVLAQFFDNVLGEYAMRVFSIVKEDPNLPGHSFAEPSMLVVNSGTGMSPATPTQLIAQPHKTMEAGEPVIPFYPIGVVEGAVPCPESTGENLRGQTTFWKDHKYTRWSVSGGPEAWFAVKGFYPLQPDFWWPEGLTGATLLDGKVVPPQISASVAFLPPNLNTDKIVPTRILYKSDWPRIAPILKAGETLTFSGGEFRADHPTQVVPTKDGGGVETIQTPGLPAAAAFAVGEVIFDALNPKNEEAKLQTDWTVRMAQVMETRRVRLSAQAYPAILQPANGKVRLYQGKYIFKDLPASLQKRLRYDPIAQELEMRGVLNDKTIDDATLTASPAAVYTLEPNIITEGDAAELYALADDEAWHTAVDTLRSLTLNPNGLTNALYTGNQYVVGLQPKVSRDEYGIAQTKMVGGFLEYVTDPAVAENARAFGVGLAVIPNGKFLDPDSDYPDVSWVTVAENNDPSMGGSPVALHVIKVDRRERYRGAIKVVLSDNVFDENVVLRHTGDFGANGDDLVYEWWYRPDDGALNVLPPYVRDPASAGDWKLFPDLSGKGGLGLNEILLKGDPNAPETLLADSWWFVRYRHKNDLVSGADWNVKQPDNSPKVNYEWAGAGNSDPFHDYNLDGYPDYKAQLSMGWIKRVLDAVNPYEARIRDFTGDAPATGSSMLQQLGPRYEGAVALNPDKNVIENVGLIELYQTVLNRASDLSINLSTPVSTPAIANALQLASTRLSDFYMLLGNEAYVDANDPTIGFGSSSVEYGAFAPVVHAFQNQASSLLEEELMLLRGQDDNMARPVYNRLFWNFTKGEGEAAYAMNYNISDINGDGFIDEYDAMILYPQGHGDAWGHYLTALTQQYSLLRHPYFNWVSRSEFYNLMNVVMKVDFLDERKFAQIAAQKAKAGAEIVANTYRDHYTEDETAQWQGYTDVNPDRAWGVQDWARRAGQGAYFDWVAANALLPAKHPNETLEGIQKVDRQENADIRLVAANLNLVQSTLDDADRGFNPLGISAQAVPFDINPQAWDDGVSGGTHFEQIYERAVAALVNAQAAWDYANAAQNRLRAVANTEAEFRNSVAQQDIAYRNQLIEIFGRPYPGTVGSGKFYPDGYIGPDLMYHRYVAANSMEGSFPQPLSSAFEFKDKVLSGGDIYKAMQECNLIKANGTVYKLHLDRYIDQVSATFAGLGNDGAASNGTARAEDSYSLASLDFNFNNNPLAGFGDYALPVMACTYSAVAPASWGERPAIGEVQQIIAEMLQQQLDVADAVSSYQGMVTDAVRALNLLELQREIDDRIAKRKQDLFISKSVINTILQGIKLALEIKDEAEDTVMNVADSVSECIPKNLPTGGVAVSPGDAAAPARGTIKSVATITKGGLGAVGIAAKLVGFANETLWEITEGSVNLVNDDDARLKSYIEALAAIDGILGKEADLRLAMFAKAERMRSIGDKYRSTVSKGSLIIDEREAFNRRTAAMTQMNRYQDMTFRVQRNHALQNYHRLLDIAARYAYLAAKAYDYETNLAADDPGSPSALFEQIVKARSLGHLADGVPQTGSGLADALAQLSANYGVLKHRLGLTNPQVETGKLSLRTEHFRIFPDGYDDPETAVAADWRGANNAYDNWNQALQKARVKDLWSVPEYRYLARPFNNSSEAEPGIVLRFSTQVKSGNNVFGNPLAGGDHAYDPSVYATRIRSVGVWFSGYLAEDVLSDLSATPRVYLIPTGADIMSIPNAASPDQTRVWNVLDQVIPLPVPGIGSKLPLANFVPLLDALDGRIGQQRRFSSFRAYHDSGTEAVDIGELVRDSRLVGRSVWNTGWVLIIPGRALNADPDEGLDRFIENVSDIKLVFETYGFSGN